MLQITTVTCFTCQTHLFIIIRSRNLILTLVLPPPCCLSFCKYGPLTKCWPFLTICYHSQFRYLQVSIAHTSHVRESSLYLRLSIGNYIVRRWCALKDVILVILGIVKTGRMVQMFKHKGQANKGTKTTRWYYILYFSILHGDFLRTWPDRLCGQPILQYNRYWVFSRENGPRRGVEHKPQLSLRLREDKCYTSPHLGLCGQFYEVHYLYLHFNMLLIVQLHFEPSTYCISTEIQSLPTHRIDKYLNVDRPCYHLSCC
jgi:hypothetical protein